MEKLNVEYLYQAMEGMDEAQADELAKLIEKARKLQDKDKQEKPEKTSRPKKPYLLITAEPLKGPILGWIIQKDVEMVAARNENSEIEEGIEPRSWGDLEITERICKVATYINETPKVLKKVGPMECIGDVMQYAPARICKDQGFSVKTKEPVAIVPVSWMAKEPEGDGYEYERTEEEN